MIDIERGEVGKERSVIITIVYDLTNGHVSIHAPLQEKVLCLGLLEFAKNLVITAQPPNITIPPFIPPHNIKGS